MTKGTAVLRQQNEKRVLAFLRKERISSRLDIARHLKISKNTVSLIVEKYIKQHIIQEVGINETSTAGRPKIKIRIIPNSLKSVGILIQHNQGYLVVTDYYSRVIDSEIFTLDTSEPGRCLDEIGRRTAALLSKHPETLGVGVGMPGIVNPDKGFVHYSSHLGWSDVDVSKLLSLHISLPLQVMNNVKASALATLQQLETETADSTFYIRIDEGVGGAFLIRDKLHFGGSWTAGEVGHLMIDPTGPLCQCGRKGCLEALIRTKAVRQRLQQLEAEQYTGAHAISNTGSEAHVSPWGNAVTDRNTEDKSVLIDAPLNAWEGLTPEDRVYTEVGQYLSTALTHIIHLCNPKQIVIDSPYGDSEHFKQITMRLTQGNTLRFPYEHADILFVRNRENPAVGAALSVIQNFENYE